MPGQPHQFRHLRLRKYRRYPLKVKHVQYALSLQSLRSGAYQQVHQVLVQPKRCLR
ncbi:hypothetical protein MGSAQ_001544 [marine sediment metagenome]|uniref:Uncharacterized protein n=1 Tax=marine sediment metagenome TaxID=412755 RepID=A0A1B6NU01_9ZZZZ